MIITSSNPKPIVFRGTLEFADTEHIDTFLQDQKVNLEKKKNFVDSLEQFNRQFSAYVKNKNNVDEGDTVTIRFNSKNNFTVEYKDKEGNVASSKQLSEDVFAVKDVSKDPANRLKPTIDALKNLIETNIAPANMLIERVKAIFKV